jgi:GTP cyclohydrolase I
MAYNPQKCDAELGRRVQAHLVSKGLQTPTIDSALHKNDDDKIDEVRELFTKIMETLGLDLSDDSLTDTPHRVAKMFVREIFWGMDPDKFPKATTVNNKMHYDEMVVERGINVQSNCEHHFVVIDGLATVAYIPNKVVLGLSKMNRIVEYFAKRPQIQERLTEQVFHALQYILDTDDVAVLVDARHFCVKSRGVEDVNSSTVTSRLGGKFKDDIQTRGEFMSIANRC